MLSVFSRAFNICCFSTVSFLRASFTDTSGSDWKNEMSSFIIMSPSVWRAAKRITSFSSVTLPGHGHLQRLHCHCRLLPHRYRRRTIVIMSLPHCRFQETLSKRMQLLHLFCPKGYSSMDSSHRILPYFVPGTALYRRVQSLCAYPMRVKTGATLRLFQIHRSLTD